MFIHVDAHSDNHLLFKVEMRQRESIVFGLHQTINKYDLIAH